MAPGFCAASAQTANSWAGSSSELAPLPTRWGAAPLPAPAWDSPPIPAPSSLAEQRARRWRQRAR
eukprot:9959959-Alexandrium_andersonii.AAC.1